MAGASQNPVKCVIPGSFEISSIDVDAVKDLVSRSYGLVVEVVTELESFDDRNIHVKVKPDGKVERACDENINYENGCVLKITNLYESRDLSLVDNQTNLIVMLNLSGSPKISTPIRQVNGFYHATSLRKYFPDKDTFRLFDYIPGKTLDKVEVVQDKFLLNYGIAIFKLTKALSRFNFMKKSYCFKNHKTIWSLKMIQWLQSQLNLLEGTQYDIALISKALDEFETMENDQVPKLAVGIVHGDLNNTNIVLTKDELDVNGILDFGDMHAGLAIYDLGSAFAHLLLRTESLEKNKLFLDGYRYGQNLSEAERKIFRLTVIVRLIQSLMLGILIKTDETKKKYSASHVAFYMKDIDKKYFWAEKLYQMKDNEFLETLGIPIE